MSLTVRLIICSVCFCLTISAFMTYQHNGNWEFILSFRGTKLWSLTLIAINMGIATLIFQTIVGNRLLTPSLMGFDALYALIQTLLIFILGGFHFLSLPDYIPFTLSSFCMLLCSLGLYGHLFHKSQSGLGSAPGSAIAKLLLTGLIFSILFRAIRHFIERLIDPNDFVIAATSSLAQFNDVKTELLAVSTLLTILLLTILWPLRFRLDALALGKQTAISLGLKYRFYVYLLLGLIAALVSISTALVGPLAFFGLLVCHIGYFLFPTYQHNILIPAISMIAAITLIGSQFILEQVFNFATPLATIVEFMGGMTFLLLILKGKLR